MTNVNGALKILAVVFGMALIAFIAVWDGGPPPTAEITEHANAAQACATYVAAGTPCSPVSMGTTVFEVRPPHP